MWSRSIEALNPCEALENSSNSKCKGARKTLAEKATRAIEKKKSKLAYNLFS